MKVRAVDPNANTGALLAGAQCRDAYSIAIDDDALDARQAAQRMVGRSPQWIDALLALGNFLVTPFGLKTGAPKKTGASDIIGLFPVVSETPDRLVAGFNDKHLDFRVVVDVASPGRGQRVTGTTLALTQNVL